MFITEIPIRVRYAETDQMNVVYHGNYAAYFESARTEAIRNLGITYKELEAMGVIMPIVEMKMKFIRPAHYDDLLRVEVKLKELPLDHKIEFEHQVRNEAGQLITTAHVTLFFLDAKTMEKIAMPRPLQEKLLPYFN